MISHLEIFIISRRMTSHMPQHPKFCFYSFTSTQLCFLVHFVIVQSQIPFWSIETLPFCNTLKQQCLLIRAVFCRLPMHVMSCHDKNRCTCSCMLTSIAGGCNEKSSKILRLGVDRSHRSIHSHLFSLLGMLLSVLSGLDEILSDVHQLHLLPKYH